MGCVSSKQAVSVTPAYDHSGHFRDGNVCKSSSRGRLSWADLEKKKKKNIGDEEEEEEEEEAAAVATMAPSSDLGESNHGESLSFRLGNLHKYVEREQVAAGWPPWLSAVAGEAIQGWVPLKADAYEKLEKIGQGTYSSVFRARDLDTGKIVALKKVRFDNFEPESVRFMAREILILRRLDHPNIMKLQGLITSRLSSSIYLVFEYMEHDITGLLSSPDVKFSESQIKCYMKQLLSGVEHCHSRGIMHRDIKGSNLLVNNEGILKIADFGLANLCSSGLRQPLTSRVVTLWYRPPELLLGATNYGTWVDLWSVGCVFAEVLVGKPVLQGRTEVEQLHKIFKLCGSPVEEYWKRSRLPHATLFKPQQPYDSCLRETFKDLPPTAVDLIETLLSVEPHNRGTASSALASEYFQTMPYACDPSTLPKYSPSKEIDAKNREEGRRKKTTRGGRVRAPDTATKPSRTSLGINKLVPSQDIYRGRTKDGPKTNSNGAVHILKEVSNLKGKKARKTSLDLSGDISHIKNPSQGDVPFSGPLEVSSSSGFAWAKRRKDDARPVRSHTRSTSRGHIFNVLNNVDSKRHENNSSFGDSRGSYELNELQLTTKKQWGPFDRTDSFDASDEYHSQDLSAFYLREHLAAKKSRSHLGYDKKSDQVEFSGPLLSQKDRVDELLEKHERHIRQATRKSWFERAKKQAREII